MTASPIFHQLVIDSSAQGIALDFKIPAFSKATMTEVCRFAYCENVNFNQHNMIDILAAATKLKMNFLVEKTINYIGKEGLNENTVFKILEANERDKNLIINMKCIAFINKNHQKCFKSSDFLHVSTEILRMLLLTCKLPQVAAKEAIALWSAHPDNATEELDELIALVTLNDYPDESVCQSATDQSDTESVGSQMSSRAGSVMSGYPQRNRRDRNLQRPNQQQNNNRQVQNGFPNRNQQQSNRQAQQGFVNRSQMQPLQQCQQISRPHQFVPVMMDFPSSCGMNLSLEGEQLRKRYQFANLNLMSGPNAIVIKELRFIYDLSTTDKELQVVISDMTAQRQDLFFSTALTKDTVNGKFMTYKLPRPCQVAPGRKIWISVEFSKPEHRVSLENYTASKASSPGGLGLRPSSTANGQIIWFVGYDLA